MKKLTTLLIFSIIGIFGSIAYENLPEILDGSMSLYDFDTVEASPFPDSLKVIHIDYIARHGARYLTSESKVKNVLEILEKSRLKGSITAKGEGFILFLDSIRNFSAGKWGLLSDIGIEQERRLAEDMAKRFPEIFEKETGMVSSVSSYVPRVVETMDYFTIALTERFQGLETNSASGRRFDDLTRFFVSDSIYNAWREQGNWKKVYDNFSDMYVPVGPARRLVGNDSGMSEKELRRLSYDLYKVLQGLRAMNFGVPTTEWMTVEEYKRCWEATNLEKYFQYSVSSLSDIPARGAINVLNFLDNNLNKLIEGKSEDLPGTFCGIFGHAETLLPIMAIMDLKGTVALQPDYTALAESWNDAELVPLAANIAIIYAQDDEEEIFAAIRLNGHNIPPITGNPELIVPIRDLSAFWKSRIEKFKD